MNEEGTILKTNETIAISTAMASEIVDNITKETLMEESDANPTTEDVDPSPSPPANMQTVAVEKAQSVTSLISKFKTD